MTSHSKPVSYPLSFLNATPTCEWEVGLVHTSSVDPIAFYDRPRRTRWWGLVRFSLGTALHFTIEPLASQPTPHLPFGCGGVFLQKQVALEKKKKREREMTPVALGLSSVA